MTATMVDTADDNSDALRWAIKIATEKIDALSHQQRIFDETLLSDHPAIHYTGVALNEALFFRGVLEDMLMEEFLDEGI